MQKSFHVWGISVTHLLVSKENVHTKISLLGSRGNWAVDVFSVHWRERLLYSFSWFHVISYMFEKKGKGLFLLPLDDWEELSFLCSSP